MVNRVAMETLPTDRESNARMIVATDAITLGWLDFASWISDDLLMAVGWFHILDGTTPDVFLVRDETGVQLDAHICSYPRPDIQGGNPRAGKVLIARVPDPPRTGEALGTIVIQTDAATIALGPADIASALTDLPSLLSGSIAGLDAEERTQILAFLSTIPLIYRTGKDVRLSKSLATTSEALRERLPYSVIAADQRHGLYIDALLAADEQAYYLKGWMRTGDDRPTRMFATMPEGSRVALPEQLFYFRRPDVDSFYGNEADSETARTSGFICYFETPAPSYLRTGWTIAMHTADGTAMETAAPAAIREPESVREMLFADLVHGRDPFQDLVPAHTYPAMSRLQAQHQAQMGIERVDDYGTPSAAPVATVVVPLYRRIDFLEHQLAQFVHDPDFAQADLIYVLDSPELAQTLQPLAAQLFLLYGIPFRVVYLKQNVGFSGANNAGAFVAQGETLLFMNSDVLPDQPGWLSTMTARYRATPKIGALGPKLLYEDDSIQHAGMYFDQPMGTTIWQNMHYYKGMHRSLPAANISRPVPAVTGACLMVDRSLYESVGRLAGTYVQGDYEDSDLCVRLIEAGYENWYCAEAELYHLEAQSYLPASRAALTQYNAWVHTHLWGESIARVMEQYTQW